VNVAMATAAGTRGKPNEDFVGAVSGAAVLLDGAGITGTESICRHGVAWYTHRLGGVLLGRLSLGDGHDVVTILGDAIEEVATEHCATCDIADPSSPQATVMIFRVGCEHVDFLALGDSFLILDRLSNGPRVVTDEREVTVRRLCSKVLDGVAVDTPDYKQARSAAVDMLRARRNQPDGYWIAKDDPRAAAQALTGRLPVRELTAAALLSNGASRIVDPYGLARWRDIPNLLGASGPVDIIRRVRRAEASGCGAGRSSVAKAAAAADASIAYRTELGPADLATGTES